jgi:hypothetical protein
MLDDVAIKGKGKVEWICSLEGLDKVLDSNNAWESVKENMKPRPKKI